MKFEDVAIIALIGAMKLETVRTVSKDTALSDKVRLIAMSELLKRNQK